MTTRATPARPEAATLGEQRQSESADEAILRLLRTAEVAGMRALLERHGTPAKAWLHLEFVTGDADLIDACVDAAALEVCRRAQEGELRPGDLRAELRHCARSEFLARAPGHL